MRFILIAILCLLSVSCSQPPAVEAIQAIMKDIETAAENKNTSEIMQHIHDAFRGNEHVDKSQLRKLLTVHFLRHNNITILITQMDIEHDPAQPYYATMNGTVAITGAENILPQDGRIYSVSGNWELHGDAWLLSELTWQ